MEAPAQTCVRLVAALEDLVAREAATLEARDFPAVIELQQRAAPLVALLGARASDVTDPALRARHGAAGEKRSLDYSWDRINRSVADTYLRLIRQRQARAAR